MKRISTFAIIVLSCFSGFAFAQMYMPSEREIAFGKTSASAWVIHVDEEPLDALRKNWASYVKKELRLKSKKDGRDALISKAVNVPSISPSVGDLRMKAFTENGESYIAVAFTTGYSISINTLRNPREADNLRQLSRDFVRQYKVGVLDEQLSQYNRREKSL